MDWQPIETVPTDGTPFLAGGLYSSPVVCVIEHREAKYAEVGWFRKTRKLVREGGEVLYALMPDGGLLNFRCHYNFTHWMPLPEPPKP